MNADRYDALKERHRNFKLEPEEINELFQWMDHLNMDNAALRVDLMASRAARCRANDPTVMTDAEVAQDLACEGL